MRNLFAASLQYKDGQLLVLDQTLLPQQEKWMPCNSADEMVDLIRRLAIRGAPVIGIAPSLLLGHLAEQGIDQKSLQKMAEKLREARPTAVNLMYCMDRMLAVLNSENFNLLTVVKTAEMIFEEDVILCQLIAKNGASLIQSGDNILTHCNTGALVTAGMGTALGVIFEAHRQGKRTHVYVDETRPLLQGGRLTTWELEKNQIPYTLICDSMAADLMCQGKIQKVLVGADRIAANGDFANKIGTYSLAVLAHYHHIPFYVVAPRTTVDCSCPNGLAIPIEERNPAEVRGISGYFGSVSWSTKNAPVYNPAFDVTPAHLVTGWILDSGIYVHDNIAELLQ